MSTQSQQGGPSEPFERISVDQAKALIDAGTVQLVDVRETSEWDQGHISGAILMPVNDVITRTDELDGSRPILFHCAMGVRSALACEMAAAFGHTDLYNMEGGFDEWKKKGYPWEA